MADYHAGVTGDIKKPEVLAEAIVNAAQERFSGMAAEQIAHNPVGVMKAGLSHLSKREERETGSVHKGGLASLAQGAYNSAQRGIRTEVEDQVERVMSERKLD